MEIIGTWSIGKLNASNLLCNFDVVYPKAITYAFLDGALVASRIIPVTETDHRFMLDDTKMDTILIAAPLPQLALLRIEASLAVKNIFCNKPIALNQKVILNALAEVDHGGVKLQVGFICQFDTSFAAVQQQVVFGTLGYPHVIRHPTR